MARRALLITLGLKATIWTYAIFEVVCKTNLAKSRHFFDLCALSADLRSLSAFQFSALLTLGIRITLALAAAVFAAALGNFLQTRSTVVFWAWGVMCTFTVYAVAQSSSILVFFNKALNRCAYVSTFVVLALCNFLFNPVINFILVIAFKTHPELSVIIGSIIIMATRSLALIVVDRILIVSTTVTNPALWGVAGFLLLFKFQGFFLLVIIVFFSFRTIKACWALFDKFIFFRTLPATKLLNWEMFQFHFIAPVVNTYRFRLIVNTLTIRTFPTFFNRKSILVELTYHAIITHTQTAIAIIAVPFAWLNFIFLKVH